MVDVLAAEEVFLSEEDLALEAERDRLRNFDPAPLKKMVDEYRDGTSISREVGEKGRRYYDGDQLDESMTRALRRSRQPRVIRNEIKPAINGLLGVIQQAKVDPKAYPRNPQDEDQADVATKALRYVADKNKFHKVKVDTAETHLIEGISAAIVTAGEDGDPLIIQIKQDEWIYDPRARMADFSDASYMGIGKWMYEQDVLEMYPHFEDEIRTAYNSVGWGSSLGLDVQDKPGDVSTNWVDGPRRRLFVVELYYRDEVWQRAVFFNGGVLEHGESPYHDDNGLPRCPIVMGSCFIDTDNQRYGMTRSMILPQDELNAYTSRALHLANSRQIQIADPSNPPDVDASVARKEAARPDGAIPAGWAVVPTQDLLQSIMMMAENARQALIRQAPTPAVLADSQSSSASGRAKMVQQQAGMTETARAFGRFEDWERGVYESAWLVLKQFKTEPWWLRITGDEGKQSFEGINQPADANGNPLDPQVVQVMQAQGIRPPQIVNDLARMSIDIEVETIPDTANLQAEQFEALTPMLPVLAQAIGPEPAFKVGLALSSVPDKQYIREIIDGARGQDDPQAQQMAQMQQQMQQMAQQMEMMMAQAKVREANANAALKEAQANETQADTVLKAAQFQAGLTIDAQ